MPPLGDDPVPDQRLDDAVDGLAQGIEAAAGDEAHLALAHGEDLGKPRQRGGVVAPDEADALRPKAQGEEAPGLVGVAGPDVPEQRHPARARPRFSEVRTTSTSAICRRQAAT